VSLGIHQGINLACFGLFAIIATHHLTAAVKPILVPLFFVDFEHCRR